MGAILRPHLFKMIAKTEIIQTSKVLFSPEFEVACSRTLYKADVGIKPLARPVVTTSVEIMIASLICFQVINCAAKIVKIGSQ